MEHEGRVPEDKGADDDMADDDVSFDWSGVDDPAAEGTDDVLEIDEDEVPAPAAPVSEAWTDPGRDVPWDELAEDTTPKYEEASFVPAEALGDEPAFHPDDEAPPQGDPLEQAAEPAMGRDRPAARMDSLHDALSSIRQRVQSLSDSMETGSTSRAGGRTSELSLYRQATDDRTITELRRHGHETEELLRRMSAVMQDLSLDLRSIVDAARRAIDQTSAQAESSVELGRLLGERIEHLDEQLAARLDLVDEALADRIDAIDSSVGTLQSHVDKRLTKIEQRSGVGVLREEIGELRSEMGDVRTVLSTLRDEVTVASAGAGAELQQRLEVVGGQLDRTLATLRDLVEGVPEQDEAVVDEVVSAIKNETEAAVEPFRLEVEALGRQLGTALEREEQLGDTLGTLTEEVSRLRKRIAVRAAPPTIDDDQIQAIVDAVVAALPGRRAAALAARAEEPEPAPKPRPVRARRSRKAAPPEEPAEDFTEPEEPEEPEELDVEIDVPDEDDEAEEEPIRRARGRGGKKASRPLVKGRRARSGSR